MATVSSPIMLGGIPLTSGIPKTLSSFVDFREDRILVLVQLTGGNDGLSTVIPLDQYDVLNQLRGNIQPAESVAIPIDNNLGLHPALTGLKTLYDEDRVSIIQNVGYPNQDRSHFRSTDIWSSASDSSDYLDTGWLGRILQKDHPNYPAMYPNENYRDPLALTIGSSVSETCQGHGASYSLAISDVNQILAFEDPSNISTPNNCYGQELRFLIESIQTSNDYRDRLIEANNLGMNSTNLYVDEDELNEKLKLVARLISGGLQTKIFVVSIGGFDTHAQQASGANKEGGRHGDLMTSVGSSLLAFMKDLEAQSLDDRVLCMTFSEFGRQVRSNLSVGTDHGTAAPLFVVGNCIKNKIIGEHVQLDPGMPPQAGIPMQYDFRDVYGTVMQRWMESGGREFRDCVYQGFQPIDVFSDNCLDFVSVQDQMHSDNVSVFPNPVKDQLNINLKNLSGSANLEIYNMHGALLYNERKMLEVNQNWHVNVQHLVASHYVIRLVVDGHRIVKPFIKIN